MNDPLVPENVDLRDFPYMPLDVRRLRDARIVAVTSSEEFRAAILLWCAAWHQIPAGSLPNDDIELAQLAGFGRALKEWQKVKSGALYGWTLCSDGRLYHPVIADKVIDAANEKIEHAYRREYDRVRKENKQREEAKQEQTPIPRRPERISKDAISAFRWNSDGIPMEFHGERTGSPPEGTRIPSVKGMEVKGRERNISLPEFATLTPEAPVDSGGDLKPQTQDLHPASPKQKNPGTTRAREANAAPGSETWSAYAAAYRARYGTEPLRDKKINSQLKQFVARVGGQDAPHIAAFFVRHNKAFYVSRQHAVGILLADAEGLRTQWLAGRTVTETEARQADRTQSTANAFGPLIEAARAKEIADGNR